MIYHCLLLVSKFTCRCSVNEVLIINELQSSSVILLAAYSGFDSVCRIVDSADFWQLIGCRVVGCSVESFFSFP